MRRTLVTVALLAVFALGGAALGLAAGGGDIASFLFGPKLMRAEVVMTDGSDYLADRGRITAVTPTSLTLREADQRVVTVAVSSSTRVTFGPSAPFAIALVKRGMVALVVYQSNTPAMIVQVSRR